MLSFIARRLGLLIPTFFGVTLLTFALIRLIPGDPVEVMMGERRVDPEMHAQAMERLGLNKPLYAQYFDYIGQLASGNLGESLRISRRLLEVGMHPLAILAGLRNHLRKLLLVRALQEASEPAYSPGLAFPAFQKGYLAGLKEARPLPALLAGHPYVLYKVFRQAERTTAPQLKAALRELLAAEFRLKGSMVPEGLALEAFFFRTVAGAVV